MLFVEKDEDLSQTWETISTVDNFSTVKWHSLVSEVELPFLFVRNYRHIILAVNNRQPPWNLMHKS